MMDMNNMNGTTEMPHHMSNTPSSTEAGHMGGTHDNSGHQSSMSMMMMQVLI